MFTLRQDYVFENMKTNMSSFKLILCEFNYY